MPAVKVIRSLLLSAAPVATLVAARVTALRRKENDNTLPALVLTRISSLALPTAGAASQARMSTDRVQVDCLAADYVTLQALVKAVDNAVTYQRGTVAGIQVQTIFRDSIGPDDVNDELAIYSSGIDFLVTYTEP